jgi:thymidylate kinase
MPSQEVFNSRLFRIYKYDETERILYPNSLLLLIMSEMLQITKEIIIPYLKQGKIVICEGYIYFIYCYLIHKKVLNNSWFYTLKNEFIRPNIVFYVNVDFKTSINRILECDDKRIINPKGHKKFVARFKKFAKKSRFTQLLGNNCNSANEKDIEKILKDKKVIL